MRGRASDHQLEGSVELAPGQSLLLEESQLSPVEYARPARKGGTDRTLSHGPWLAYQFRSPLWSGATGCHGLRGGHALALPQLSLSAGLGACRSTFENQVLRPAPTSRASTSRQRMFGISFLSAAFGGHAAASWLRQRFTTSGRAPGRDSFGLGLGALIGASAEISHGYYAFGAALGQVLFSTPP